MKPKILVVDDDETLLSLYKSAFTARGYQVFTANNGEKALSLANQEKPDLVLLDIMMPEVHGLNVLDILKATPGLDDTKVIILTALSDENTKEKALELGANGYIVKSENSMAEIIDKVHEAIYGNSNL